jgi:uncharacterized Zn-binding protein involved in type VI secretion
MSPLGDKLKLADPQGSAPDGNAALGQRSLEDQIAERAQLADSQKQIAQLERSNAALERRLAQEEQAAAKAKAGGHGKVRHMAHAEGWQAICTAPDFCKVGKDVVAFNSFATLDKRHTASSNVKARGTTVYRKGDLIKNIQADAGKHVVSGTSLGSGYVKILDGHDNVKVNGIPVARHDSRCLINCDAAGVGGAQGKLVTEQKRVGGDASPLKDTAPPGERSSEKLTALKKARASVADGMLNLNAADEYVNFEQSNEVLNGLIAQISGTSGTALGYAAQVTRGLLGFGKDFVMGVGELAYEGIKAAPKLVQLTQTQSGKLLTQLDAQILAENIKLSNITPGTVGRGALNIGKAIVKPVTDPWAKGQYVESVTRGAMEIGTLGLGWLKGNKGARAAKAADATKVADAASAADLAKAADEAAAKTARATVGHVDDGVHVKLGKKPEFSGDWKNYKTHGITADPMKSPEGRRLVKQFEEQGMSERTAIKEARELIKTGSSMPVANPIEVGDKLFKIIPEGSSVGPNSAFWATETELGKLKGLTYNQIAERLGLPLTSQQGAKFQVMEIAAFRNGTSFTSVIAPTTEIGANGMLWSQRGGGLQTLLTDRSIFTQPKPTSIKFP